MSAKPFPCHGPLVCGVNIGKNTLAETSTKLQQHENVALFNGKTGLSDKKYFKILIVLFFNCTIIRTISSCQPFLSGIDHCRPFFSIFRAFSNIFQTFKRPSLGLILEVRDL